MVRYRWSRLLLGFAACILFAGSALAQTKVAVISLQKALLDTAEIKKAQAAMEAKFKPKQDQMAILQKEIEAIQQQLQTMQGKLTPQAEQDLVAQGQRKQRQMQRLTEDLQAEVEMERNAILGRSGQRMQEVVKTLAETKGLDIVVDLSNTIYFKPAMDITQEATAAYDKTHPAQ